MTYSTARIAPFLMALVVACNMTPGQFARAAEPAKKKVIQTPTPPEGWVIIHETVWMRLADQPGEHMKKAQVSFLKKDYKAAASEIRKAAAYLYGAASYAAQDAKKGLIASAHEMDKLAVDVEKGAVKSTGVLKATFARAEHALARHHYLKASESMAKRSYHSAGHFLHSAVSHMEGAAGWAGHELKGGTVAALNGGRTVAGKLIQGSGFVVDEAGKAVGLVGSEVEKLGKVIEPRKKSAPKK